MTTPRPHAELAARLRNIECSLLDEDENATLREAADLLDPPPIKRTITLTVNGIKRVDAEQARIEAERERIRQEEERKSQAAAEQAAEAERQRIRAEEQAKAKAEAQAAREAQAQQAIQQAAEPAAAPAAPAPAPWDADEAPTLKLGDVNARLTPIQVTADGLRELGIEPAGRDKRAVLYSESQFTVICEAIAGRAIAAKRAALLTA